MEKQKNFTWLWLEPEPMANADIIQYVKNAGIEVIIFSHVNQLILFLIENEEILNQYGLLLEVMLCGNAFIPLPLQWTGVADQHVKTISGYDAGLVFYEEFVMNKLGGWKPFWSPLPPVVFLTSKLLSNSERQRLDNIKGYWLSNNSTEKLDVHYVRKWSYEKELINYLKLGR